MTTQEKIREAKRLMFEVTTERLSIKKTFVNNQYCECGHKRNEHSETYSINYTEGFCSKCECEHFLLSETPVEIKSIKT